MNSTKFPNSGWLYAGICFDVVFCWGVVPDFLFVFSLFGEINSSAKIIIPKTENKIIKKILRPELSGVVKFCGISVCVFAVFTCVERVVSAGAVISGGEEMLVIIVRSL